MCGFWNQPCSFYWECPTLNLINQNASSWIWILILIQRV